MFNEHLQTTKHNKRKNMSNKLSIKQIYLNQNKIEYILLYIYYNIYNKNQNMLTRIAKRTFSTYNTVNMLANGRESVVKKSELIGLGRLNKQDRLKTGAIFLKKEMPIRLARRVKELEKIPFNFNTNQHCEINQIRDWYVTSMEDIINAPNPNTYENCKKFSNIINKIVDRHSNTLTVMAKGIKKLRNEIIDKNDNDINDEIQINRFLTNFYKNRTKTRLLLQNFLQLSNINYDYSNNNSEIIGIINQNCILTNVLRNAIDEVECITLHNHLELPEFNINIDDLNFTYVEFYLKFVLVEILKNSVKAVNDINNENKIIDISSFKDNNMYILKIKDNGIGIKESDLGKIYNFSYTTSDFDFDEGNENSPISGFGYGLSLSKVILKTFGDHIEVFSEYGKGSEAYITLYAKKDWVL